MRAGSQGAVAPDMAGLVKRSAHTALSLVGRTAEVGLQLGRFALTQPRQFWRALERQAARASSRSTHLQYVNGLPSISPLSLVQDPALAGRSHLNVLLPGVALWAMSGGPNTVVNLVYRMAARGVPVRLISTDVPMDRDHGPLWSHFAALTGLPGRLDNVEIRCAFDRTRPFPIGENDVFFASAWWNVQMIKRALRLTRPQRFLYIIQDYEPGLYAWSTEYALALETYHLDYRAFVCESLLADYLVQNRIGNFADPAFRDRYVVFEPAVDRSRFHAEEPTPGRPFRLLFYARPESARRNLFELGLYALRCCSAEGVFAGDAWELLFIGEPLPAVSLDGGLSIRSAPWLDYAGYAGLFRQSDVLLSLMLSPHTSYPPLEMAASGGWVVTNTFANKTAAALTALSPRIVPVAPTLEGVVAGVREAVARARTRSRTAAPVAMPPDWATALDGVADGALDAYADCLRSA